MIHLEGIHRFFRVGDQQVHALDDINLEIAAGDYLSLMGPSGSGKSTLLNIVGLLDRPDNGRYLFEGQDVTAYSDEEQARFRRERIGFVFQFFHLIPRLTAEQNIALPMVLAGMDEDERHAKAAAILDAYGLSERAHHRPEQLSGGERQRVAIGRATVMKPSIVLADEPTGNLDRASGREVIGLLESLNRQGMTLIMVTHDPELGQRASRRLHMVDGRVSEDRSA